MRGSSHLGGPDGQLANSQTERPGGNPGSGENELYIIGLGSKGPKGITLEARRALEQSTVVIGYKLYMEQAEPWIEPAAKRVVSNMTEEKDRAEEALSIALKGGKVSVVSGGDPGIYAMAGVIFEVAASKKIPLGTGKGKLKIQVVPGTPALVAGASLLGAPITHDFCAISLSDRLTDWELIKKRIDFASLSDFVIIIYNPKSHGRTWQLGEAKEILLKNKSPETPVGLCTRLGRSGEKATIIELKDLNVDEVDMQTILIVGNSTTFVYEGAMITPRGYVKKYGPGDPHVPVDDSKQEKS